jgi:signal transduction histidine kinase
MARTWWRSVPRTDYVVLPVAAALELVVWQGGRQLRGGGLVPVWLVPAGVVVVFATLAMRRRVPGWVLTGQLLWATGTAIALPMYSSFAGVLVGMHALAVRRRPTRSAIGLVACAVPFGIQAYGIRPTSWQWVIGWVVAMIAAAAAWGLGYRAWVADLRVTELEAHRVASTEQALQAERLCIARELHDIVAHAVSAMVLQAAGARAVFPRDPSRAEQALGTIQDVGAQAMGELRRLLGLLRSTPDGQDEPGLNRPPGVEDLPDLTRRAETAGVTVSTQIDGTPGRLDPSVSLTAYRVVQEALTNTMKHVGAGASASVHLRWHDTSLTVTVADRAPARSGSAPARSGSAAATPPLSTGHGLLGLHERVTTVGGVLQTRKIPDGFVVEAVLPASQLAPALIAPGTLIEDPVTR